MKSSEKRSGIRDELVVPLVEEKAKVEKHSTVTGKLRIRISVEEIEELAVGTLDSENVEVIHVPVDREVSGDIPEVRTENGVIIVPVLEEVLFVEKRLVLKEELHIHRHNMREKIETPVKLRRQRAVVERAVDKNPTESKE